MHIRNAPTNMMKELGYGADYNYAHNRQDAFVPGESYLPESLYGERYYFPVDRGLEIKIASKLDHLRRLNEESDFQRYESDVGDDNCSSISVCNNRICFCASICNTIVCPLSSRITPL